MGIFNYQGLYYDILGISTYGSFDPHDVKHLKELEISGEEVGYLLIKNKEFPYDWDSGEIVYIIFLSVIFSGTIVLEGTYLRLGGSNEISFIRKIKKNRKESNQQVSNSLYRCGDFDHGSSHSFKAQRVLHQLWATR